MDNIKMNLKTFFHLDKGLFKFLHSSISVLTLFIIGWLFVQGLPGLIVTYIMPKLGADGAATTEQIHAIVLNLYSLFLQTGWTIVALTFICFMAFKFISLPAIPSVNVFDLLSAVALMPVVGVIIFGSFPTIVNCLIIIIGLRTIVNLWEYYYEKNMKKRMSELENFSSNM